MRLDLAMQQVLSDVVEERKRQNRIWGEQNHDPVLWLAILMEEVGEAAKDVLESQTTYSAHPQEYAVYLRDMRQELIEVIAVGFAFVECLDRGEWEWRETPPGKGDV